MDIDKVIELLECAKINIGNIAKIGATFIPIPIMQIDEAIKLLKGKEEMMELPYDFCPKNCDPRKEAMQEIKKALDNGDKIMTELKTAVEKCVELNKQITDLEAEVDEARRLQRWGDSEVEKINKLLDLMGAPATMDNGSPYNIAGRLSALTVKNAKLREALDVVLPMAKGYAAEHPVGSNQSYISHAQAALKRRWMGASYD